MNTELTDDVMKYLVPQFRFISSLMVSHNYTELGLIKKRIQKGLQLGHINFYPEDSSLDINLKSLEAEKSREWVEALKKQLQAFIDIIEKLEANA